MSNEHQKLEQAINRRVANGIWFFIGLNTAIILMKMMQKEWNGVLYGSLIQCTLYCCYSFYQRFADASRRSS